MSNCSFLHLFQLIKLKTSTSFFAIIWVALFSSEVISNENYFPYGGVPKERPDIKISPAMERIFKNYPAVQPELNELFTNFKYTPLEGLDYRNGDGTISRRDPSKVVRSNGKYYVWYTHRATPTPPRGAKGGTDVIPSTDWDLAEIWYATSKDGFTWKEQGVAVPRPPKPIAGWRSVSTPDVLFWKGKYYLYYQAFEEMSGLRGDFCPVSVSVANSPDGPWKPANKVIVPNGPEGTWDQYAIHDPYPIFYGGKIYLYYKSQLGGKPKAPMQGVAIGDHPLGPFEKYPYNPVINSGHETGLFPFKNGIAALVGRHGHEHNTIQYAPDGVSFEIAAITDTLPIAPGPYAPDAFTDTGNARGISWGLCHFKGLGGKGKSHSMLARFDCDLSLDVNDPVFKQTDTFFSPDVYFQFPLQPEQKNRIQKAMLQAK